MTPDLIIFDCDGVLIDSEIIACAADAEALKSVGYPITTSEVVRRFAGVPTDEMYAAIERDLGRPLPPDLAAQTEARVMARFHTELRPIEGVAEAVAQLERPYCVASSSKPSKLSLGLIEAGLFDLFYPHIFSAAQVTAGKPAPDLFLLAAEKMGAAARHCVVVEDSIAGVTAARRAGMRALGFAGGAHCSQGHAAELRSAGAELVFDRLALLPDIIADLSEPPQAGEVASLSSASEEG